MSRYLLLDKLLACVGAAKHIWDNYEDIQRVIPDGPPAPDAFPDYVSVGGSYVLMSDGKVWPVDSWHDENGHCVSREKASFAAVQFPDEKIAFAIRAYDQHFH